MRRPELEAIGRVSCIEEPPLTISASPKRAKAESKLGFGWRVGSGSGSESEKMGLEARVRREKIVRRWVESMINGIRFHFLVRKRVI